ncbi:putative protein OS=Streptomyces fumanus OX=67302 GN=GCM10018772_03080 PE=4 SV=1 [Streptomyces fumanus]
MAAGVGLWLQCAPTSPRTRPQKLPGALRCAGCRPGVLATAPAGAERWTPGPALAVHRAATGVGVVSLTVAAILVHDLVRRNATDDDLTRTVAIMERLADRGRITSRMTADDPVIRLHHPGVTMPLADSEHSGGLLQWRMTDYSAQMLKRIVQLAALSQNINSQGRLLQLAEQTFEHLWHRRIADGEAADLWDDPRPVYPDSPGIGKRLSWSITERVTECLVAARNLYEQQPIPSPELAQLAREMLSEANHLFGKEQLEATGGTDGNRGRAMRSIENRLDRARALVDSRPATAFALALPVLQELDTLAQARRRREGGLSPCSSSPPPTREAPDAR